LVRVADDHQAWTRRGRRQQLKELELRRIDVLELVHEDEAELRSELFAELVV